MLRFLLMFGLLLTKHWILAAEPEADVETSSSTNIAAEADVTTTIPEDTPESEAHIDRSSDLYYHRPHIQPSFQGFWKKKFLWRPRWVKTWQEKKVYVAVWKRMWGPAVLNEWVPVPKPPPGWEKHQSGGFAIKIPH